MTNLIERFILEKDLEIPNLMKLEWDITDNLNYWYKQGNNNILLVAHIDTLPRSNNIKRFKSKSKPLELISNNGIIIANNSILGADDRAGCYAIHELYHKYGTNCSILLTNFEEVGGLGVKQFLADYPDLLNEYKLFIELDRKGIDEFTHYNDFIDTELECLLMGFNFTYNVGSYSDIADLSDHYRIQSVNLSVGYYNQHTTHEYLDFNALEYLLIPRYSQLIEALESINYGYYLPIKQNKFNYLENSLESDYWDYLEQLSDADYVNNNYMTYKQFEDAYYFNFGENYGYLDSNFDYV